MSNQELNSFFKNLTKFQKWSLAGLVVLTIVIFTMWFVQLKKNIIYPIYGGKNPNEIVNNHNTNDMTDNQDLVKTELDLIKKKTDTDHDGLSDWDEENIYKTSPFLPDTDGDGISDGEEIKANTDPNCPEGEQCLNNQVKINEITNTTNNSNNNSTSKTNLETNKDSGKLSPAESEMINQVFGSNPDATKIRQILLNSGVSQSELDKVSDEQLLSTFNSLQ